MEKSIESIESSKFFSQRARMSGEFDSKKDSHSTKFKRRPRNSVKLSFKELCDSKFSSLHPLDNIAISKLSQKQKGRL